MKRHRHRRSDLSVPDLFTSKTAGVKRRRDLREWRVASEHSHDRSHQRLLPHEAQIAKAVLTAEYIRDCLQRNGHQSRTDVRQLTKQAMQDIILDLLSTCGEDRPGQHVAPRQASGTSHEGDVHRRSVPDLRLRRGRKLLDGVGKCKACAVNKSGVSLSGSRRPSTQVAAEGGAGTSLTWQQRSRGRCKKKRSMQAAASNSALLRYINLHLRSGKSRQPRSRKLCRSRSRSRPTSRALSRSRSLLASGPNLRRQSRSRSKVRGRGKRTLVRNRQQQARMRNSRSGLKKSSVSHVNFPGDLLQPDHDQCTDDGGETDSCCYASRDEGDDDDDNSDNVLENRNRGALKSVLAHLGNRCRFADDDSARGVKRRESDPKTDAEEWMSFLKKQPRTLLSFFKQHPDKLLVVLQDMAKPVALGSETSSELSSARLLDSASVIERNSDNTDEESAVPRAFDPATARTSPSLTPFTPRTPVFHAPPGLKTMSRGCSSKTDTTESSQTAAHTDTAESSQVEATESSCQDTYTGLNYEAREALKMDTGVRDIQAKTGELLDAAASVRRFMTYSVLKNLQRSDSRTNQHCTQDGSQDSLLESGAEIPLFRQNSQPFEPVLFEGDVITRDINAIDECDINRCCLHNVTDDGQSDVSESDYLNMVVSANQEPHFRRDLVPLQLEPSNSAKLENLVWWNSWSETSSTASSLLNEQERRGTVQEKIQLLVHNICRNIEDLMVRVLFKRPKGKEPPEEKVVPNARGKPEGEEKEKEACLKRSIEERKQIPCPVRKRETVTMIRNTQNDNSESKSPPYTKKKRDAVPKTATVQQAATKDVQGFKPQKQDHSKYLAQSKAVKPQANAVQTSVREQRKEKSEADTGTKQCSERGNSKARTTGKPPTANHLVKLATYKPERSKPRNSSKSQPTPKTFDTGKAGISPTGPRGKTRMKQKSPRAKEPPSTTQSTLSSPRKRTKSKRESVDSVELAVPARKGSKWVKPTVKKTNSPKSDRNKANKSTNKSEDDDVSQTASSKVVASLSVSTLSTGKWSLGAICPPPTSSPVISAYDQQNISESVALKSSEIPDRVCSPAEVSLDVGAVGEETGQLALLLPTDTSSPVSSPSTSFTIPGQAFIHIDLVPADSSVRDGISSPAGKAPPDLDVSPAPRTPPCSHSTLNSELPSVLSSAKVCKTVIPSVSDAKLFSKIKGTFSYDTRRIKSVTSTPSVKTSSGRVSRMSGDKLTSAFGPGSGVEPEADYPSPSRACGDTCTTVDSSPTHRTSPSGKGSPPLSGVTPDASNARRSDVLVLSSSLLLHAIRKAMADTLKSMLTSSDDVATSVTDLKTAAMYVTQDRTTMASLLSLISEPLSMSSVV